jgi:uncharacterized protein YggL (DUF469 family)
MYIESLITETESLEAGLPLGNMKIDILLYADDIILVSNSEAELQQMLATVQEYGRIWEIKLNPDKTIYMAFKPKSCNVNKAKPARLILNNMEIMKVNEFQYLGFHITSDLSSATHANKKRLATLITINKLKKSVLKGSTCVSMKVQIYKTFCRPILYYGAEVIDLSLKQQKDIQTTESNALKNMFHIGSRKHSTLLLRAAGLECATERLKINRLLFYLRLPKNSYTRKVFEASVEN